MNAVLCALTYRVASPVFRFLHATGLCSGPLALRGLESWRWRVGQFGAWIRLQSTARRVPAYRDFLARAMTADPRAQFSLALVPATDKENYVKQFPLEARCIDGVLPVHGVVIDESSGSSGVATNWVRGRRERSANGRSIIWGLRQRLGNGPHVFVNAFALGPWATGINLTLALSSWGRIKTTGPDITKIANTLRHFGTAHHYVIMGYPPFLKQLIDRANVDWAAFNVSMLFGGEGMSESMRRYLQDKGIARVYGSYGASDLELNMAAETELTIALRRLLESRPSLAAKVLQHAGAMPMIFQFNPADFFIETNASGEIMATVCRPGYVSPKVRYNIHDLGHVLRYPELKRILATDGISLDDVTADPLDLPLLFHYGRSDQSVAYYGCKIPPADIQESLFRLPELATAVDAFQLHTFDDADGDKRLSVRLEVAHGTLAEGAAHWATRLFDTLAAVNQDFRESRRMVPNGKAPSVEFVDAGSGVFADADIRIKRTYVAKDG